MYREYPIVVSKFYQRVKEAPIIEKSETSFYVLTFHGIYSWFYSVDFGYLLFLLLNI